MKTTTVLDVTVCTHSKGGVGRWVRGLSKGLSAVNPEHVSIDIQETHPKITTQLSEAIVLSQPFWMHFPLIRRLFFKKGFLQKSRAKRIQRKVGFPDIIHLSGVQPEGFGKKRVVTFFDDTPWTDPSSHTKETLFYAARLKKLIDEGASVLTISNWSALIAQKLFSLPDSRIGNVGGAVEDCFKPGMADSKVMLKYNLKPQRYFLHVGSFVARKNIPFLVNCFSILNTQLDVKLVFVGAEEWGNFSHKNTRNTVYLKNVSDSELVSLYQGAVSLLMPSSKEGLGLPVLEAFACNTPVISSDGGALPDTVGNFGLVLPKLSSEVWVKALNDMFTGKIYNSLKEKAVCAYSPGWSDVGKKALQFYRSLL